MNIKRLTLVSIISVLFATTIGLSVQCFILVSELKLAESNLKTQEAGEKSAYFAKLFIDKILLSSGTVDFEDRLKLENSVRDLNDKEIFTEWQKLTDSKNNAETQKIVGNILKMLIARISG